jgi:hypothetical protein
MTKIFIGTPAYSGTVHVQYALSLADTMMHLSINKIPVEVKIHCAGSLLVAERNRLITAFLKTECTHMLCIDSDLGWPPDSVKNMLDKDCDFICGIYPTRRENTFIFRPETLSNGAVVVDEAKQLLKMLYIPAGFMLIKRCVIEGMIKKFPELYYKPKDPQSLEGYCLFNTEVWQGEFWGEDYYFCRKARESGFDIWADPSIEFDHAGVRGCVSSVLTNDKDKANKA